MSSLNHLPSLMRKCKFSYCYLFFFLLLLSASQPAKSQSAPSADFSVVNVDELSDAQLKYIIQKYNLSAYSESQLTEFAKSNGMANTQIKKLQARITGLNAGSTAAAPVAVDKPREVNSNGPVSNPVAPVTAGGPVRVFGADLFNGTSSTFEPNLRLATPLNYVLGPDDQLNINVFGNSETNWKLTVSPEGNINIPGIGIQNVSGKTIEQATAAIRTKLAANGYAIGRGTSVQVTLGDIRSIKVIINGEVVKPGTYTLPSLATVFNALYASGGPNQNGSFRLIEVIRNNHVVRKLDVYDFLLKGDQSNNIGLKDQDIIRVPTYRVKVEMGGEVKRPAIYEVLPGESLQDVINFAGGFSDMAFTDKIKVLQITGNERSIADIVEGDYKNYTPLRGDKYFVDKILDRYRNKVSIGGAVYRPGDFELEKGLTVSGLIKKASGLRPDAFTSRGFITRLKDDNTTERISFSVKEILDKTAADIPLQREDVIFISSIFELRDAYNVSINGEVRSPGDFAYSDKMTVEDLVQLAGGLAEGATTKRIEVSRRNAPSDSTNTDAPIVQVFYIDINSQLDLHSSNFVLKPYDIVSVYTSPNFEKQKMVKVEGEVRYPGFYSLNKKNERISDLVQQAGGLTTLAFVEGGTLKRKHSEILGFDKNKVDTAALQSERNARLKDLAQSVNDSAIITEEQQRNNYVGIDLKKIVDKPGSVSDLILLDGDVLRIPKEQQTVSVNGQVLIPSSIVYTSGKGFKDYVQNAGGFSEDALKRRSFVIYPNGTVKGTSKFLFFNVFPEVKPGSEIYVPKKQPRKGLSTSEVIGLFGGIATLGAVILGVINLSK